jgi:hypothetical protein
MVALVGHLLTPVTVKVVGIGPIKVCPGTDIHLRVCLAKVVTPAMLSPVARLVLPTIRCLVESTKARSGLWRTIPITV